MAEAHDHGTGTHDHHFLGAGHERSERRTKIVAWLTAAFMVVEIFAGLAFGSMALLADGIHMATHAGAMGLAAGAYWLARRHAANTRFSFGSGKFGDLAAFASALVLGLVGVAVAVESAMRLLAPVDIHYREAIAIAGLGLLVNIISAFMLQDDHHHGHSHDEHDHPHDHAHLVAGAAQHRDHNLRAAYVHVLADAATSVLALIALVAAWVYGANWLDPVVGLAGAFLIMRWSYGLMRDSGLVLLDAVDDPKLARAIARTLEDELHARVADMHLWRLGHGHRGLIVSLISPVATSTEDIKALLRRRYAGLSHVTVELAVCEDCAKS